MKNFVKIIWAFVITFLGVIFLIFIKGIKPSEAMKQLEEQKEKADALSKKTTDYLNSHPKRKEL